MAAALSHLTTHDRHSDLMVGMVPHHQNWSEARRNSVVQVLRNMSLSAFRHVPVKFTA
jgi:hypothetical protein